MLPPPLLLLLLLCARPLLLSVCLSAPHSCGKGTAVVLLHPPEHLAMAALYTACKANNLQWYLGPPEADRQEQEAVALMQGHLRVREELKGEGKIRVPDLPLARLKGEQGCLFRDWCAGVLVRARWV
jgi:hypothetical protein